MNHDDDYDYQAPVHAQAREAGQVPAGEAFESVPTTNAGQVSQAAHLGTLATLVVNSQNPVVQLLGREHQRAVAYVIAVDADCYLATTKENAQGSTNAQPASPAAAPQPSSSGYLPKGIAYPWASGDQLWAAMIGTTPTRISVQIAQRSDQP